MTLLELLSADGLGSGTSPQQNHESSGGNDDGDATADDGEWNAAENKDFRRNRGKRFVHFNNGLTPHIEIVDSAATPKNGFANSHHIFSRSISLNTDLDEFTDEDATCKVCNYREKMGRKNRRRSSTNAGKKKLTRSEIFVICLLGFVDFLGFCSMSVMAPFFPEEAQKKGLDISHAGYVFSFYAFVMFITAPFFGKIIPYAGTKVVFLSGVLVNGTCNILFGMLPYIENNTLFEVCCFVVRGFEALGAGAFSTASYIYVLHMFPDNVSGVLGIMETFAGLGMSIGPALGAFMYELGGFPLPFLLLGISMILLTLIYCVALPSLTNKSESRQTGSLLNLLKLPALVITFLTIVVASNAWSFLDPTLEPHLRQLNLSSRETGLVFLSFSAFYAVFSPVWGFVSDKFNNHWSIMAVGLLGCAASLVILGPSQLTNIPTTLPINIAALCSLATSVSMVLAPSFRRLLESAFAEGYPDNLATYAVIAGVWSSAFSLGDMTGPALGGILMEYFDYPTCTTVMAIVALTMASACLFYFGIVEPRKSKVNRPGLPSPALMRDRIAYYGALSVISDQVNISITNAGAAEV